MKKDINNTINFYKENEKTQTAPKTEEDKGIVEVKKPNYKNKEKNYKNVTIRFRIERYNKILKRAEKYESFSQYINTLIDQDMSK